MKKSRSQHAPAGQAARRAGTSATSAAAHRARQRVLAQWRGVDLVPLELAYRSGVRPMERVIAQVLTSANVEQKRGETEIVKVWNHLLDPQLTAHAQPSALRQGTLFVSVDSSVWLSEIVRYRRKEILERLQHSFGSARIQRVSYRVG